MLFITETFAIEWERSMKFRTTPREVLGGAVYTRVKGRLPVARPALRTDDTLPG